MSQLANRLISAQIVNGLILLFLFVFLTAIVIILLTTHLRKTIRKYKKLLEDYKMTLGGIKDGRFECTIIGEKPVSYFFDPNCFRILGFSPPPKGQEFLFLESRLKTNRTKELNDKVLKAVNNEEDFSLKIAIRNSQDEEQWIQIRAGTHRNMNETRILGTWTDIDKEEKLRIELQKDTEGFRMLHKAIKIIRWEFNPENGQFTLTRDARGTYQMPPEELWNLFAPPYNVKIAEAFQKAIKERTHLDILAKMKFNLEGIPNQNWMRIQGFPHETSNPGFIGVAEVVTPLIESQNLYKEQHRILQTLIDNIPFGIFLKEVVKTDVNFILWNKTMGLLDSRFPEEVSPCKDTDLFSKEIYPVFIEQDRTIIKNKETIDLGQWPSKGKNQEDFLVHIHKVPILNDSGEVKYILGVIENITEKTEMERRLLQAQKLDALGKLAGGVAHDFNNMLAGIMGIAELWKAKEEDPGKLSHAENLLNISQRAAELTEQLLTFSRDRDIEMEPQDVHSIIKESVKLLQRIVDKNIQIITDLAAKSTTVLGDRSMLQNLFLNLSINSRDAMPKGGRLFFSTKNVILKEPKRKTMGINLPHNNWICIEVKDTGSGIDPTIRDRVFEPFFSTKDMGKGTGLGLSMVYGNTVKHSGVIQLNNSPKGCCFELYFPLSKDLSEESY